MNKLQQIQISLQNDAGSRLPNYETMTIEEIANGYLEACGPEYIAYVDKSDDNQENGGKAPAQANPELASAYFSAALLKYFFKIPTYFKPQCASLNLTDEELFDMLLHAIRYGLNHHKWIGSEDKNIVDKIFNRCIVSTRLIWYQNKNMAVRKANTQIYSIDNMIDDTGDSATDALGLTEYSNADIDIKLLVKDFLKRDKVIEALIIDGISKGEGFKTEKKTRSVTTQDVDGNYIKDEVEYKESIYSDRYLVSYLRSIDAEHLKRIASLYDIVDEQSVYEKLQKTTNPTLYRLIEKTKQEIKQSPRLLSFLK